MLFSQISLIIQELYSDMKKTGNLEKLKTKINPPPKQTYKKKDKTHKKIRLNIRVDYPQYFFPFYNEFACINWVIFSFFFLIFISLFVCVCVCVRERERVLFFQRACTGETRGGGERKSQAGSALTWRWA